VSLLPISHPTAPVNRRRVFVVENHAMFRENLVNWITEQEELECCGEAGSLSQAQVAVERQSPDLILLDLFLGNADGFDFLQWLKAAAIDLPVIILSQYSEHQYAVPSLEAGARGYVSKAAATEELSLAINAVFHGDCYVSGRGAFPAPT
jgi:DNA-binding NarL/FixJ family response regulator